MRPEKKRIRANGSRGACAPSLEDTLRFSTVATPGPIPRENPRNCSSHPHHMGMPAVGHHVRLHLLVVVQLIQRAVLRPAVLDQRLGDPFENRRVGLAPIREFHQERHDGGALVGTDLKHQLRAGVAGVDGERQGEYDRTGQQSGPVVDVEIVSGDAVQ